MDILIERIKKEASFIPSAGIIKVDSFLNHQLDIKLINQIGNEFFARFSEKKPTKLLQLNPLALQ